MTDHPTSTANGADQPRPVTIKTVDNGPLQVKGPVQLVDHDGTSYDVGRTAFLCRCGGSRNKPFCDGTHAKVAFAASQRSAAPDGSEGD